MSFANFFMRVRPSGFQGDNEKKFPEVAAYVKRFNDEGKKLDRAGQEAQGHARQGAGRRGQEGASRAAQDAAEIARLEKEGDKLSAEGKTRLAELRKTLEKLQAVEKDQERFRQEVADLERRAKRLPEVGRRLMHAEIQHVPGRAKAFATVTSPLGTQSRSSSGCSARRKPLEVAADQDPRGQLVAWMRRPDNPYFARAIVNRVWAHYFGRGIVDPPDNLSSFNPPSHPELLSELCEGFVRHGYDLKWLHRTILTSRTYQQSSQPPPASAADRSNYAYFYYRRLPAEVLLDALNQATGTSENMDMKYYHWPDGLKTVEMPFAPRNDFVTFVLEQFGRPERNSAVQCDCERETGVSLLQVLSLANHPRVWQKIADPNGQAARVAKQLGDDNARIEEIFLATVSRLPSADRAASVLEVPAIR